MGHLFDELDPIGKIGEAAALDLLKPKNFAIRKVDFKKEYFDIQTVGHSGIIKNWEIKTVKEVARPWDFYTLELEQLNVSPASRIPAHFKYCNDIDYMAYWDCNRQELLVYKTKDLIKWALENKEKAFTISAGTSKVIRFPRHSITAGYVGTIKK